MTIKEAIEHFESLLNAPYDRDHLVKWLAELDGQAIREVFCYYEGNPVPEDWEPYDISYNLDAELLIPAPYDSVYMDYLRMKTDYWHKENSYSNTVKAFNNSYATFCDFWRRTHKHIPSPQLKL